MIIKTICKNCGKAFVPNQERQKYCSLKCKEESYKRNLSQYERVQGHKAFRPKECLNCGKLFIPKTNSQKVCSLECAKERKKQRRKAQMEEAAKEKPKREWKDYANCPRDDCLWHNNHNEQWCSCLYCYITGKPREPRGTTWRECVEYITNDEAALRGIHKSYTEDMQNVVFARDESDLDAEVKAYAEKHSYEVDYFGEDEN